jgi:hypothetical protein
VKEKLEGAWGNGGTNPRILNLGSVQALLVSFIIERVGPRGGLELCRRETFQFLAGAA